jgi:hypothetical protein
MLRNWLIAIAFVALACGVIAFLAGTPPAFILVFWGALIFFSLVYERVRYKPLETAAPGPGWTQTTERFIDDETGEPVTVWLESGTGERKYVRG